MCAFSCDVFSFIRHLSRSVCRWRQTDAAQKLVLCAARIRRQRQYRFHLPSLVFCAVFAARPPHTWEHGRRADCLQPLTGSPGVLLITTRGRPPGLTCRATGVSLSPAPWSNAKEVASTPFRAKCIARRRPAHCRPKGGQQCGRLHVLALFPVSLVWAGTYLPCWYTVVKLQVKGGLKASHPIANGRGGF